ncbi:hypothetical protein IYY11_01700 [Methylocystis sp. H62]|uniref:hypothetical protein n=1 Tax=Methylocystis sp. H62 TaxID=2785789 RepID=UPI0018C29C04|nr:hypothetical protein [Methylocystis sp. H62]MBG0792192.1 hypothetical protein [Methylocystis sp. H62]
MELQSGVCRFAGEEATCVPCCNVKRPPDKRLPACTFADKRHAVFKNECKKCNIRRNLFGDAYELRRDDSFGHASSADAHETPSALVGSPAAAPRRPIP